MTFQSAQNAAYSLVATAPSTPTGGTSLVVTAGEGARFSGITTPFYATVWATGAQPVWAPGSAAGGNFEIVQVTNVTTDTLTIVRAREGTTARTVLVGDQIAETWTAATFRNAQNLPRSARSSNTILGVTDGGTVICATAAYTQTLTAAATLGAGWWVIVKNDTSDGTTVLVLDPNSSETIDGLTTATMYSGETRLIECDGANFTSQMLAGGYAKFVPSGLGTFVVPAGITEADVVCIGSGGQGGGGWSGGAGSGAGGGGGGAVSRAIIRAVDLGSAGTSITVTAAAGGTGAGSATNNGADGAATTFGARLKAGGGGGGTAGGSASASTGGGGGSVVNSAVGITAGSPGTVTAIGGQAASANTAGSNTGRSAEWGGASGGCAASGGAGQSGGSSIYGGPGGGSGGSQTNSGGNGGANQSYAAGGGTSGGTGGASPQAGGSGAATTPTPFCGQAGGGGGGTATAATTAGVGGAGGIGAGGGGGGAGTNATGVGGAGGNGGAGECRVVYS